MNKEIDKNEFVTQKKGPIWNARVDVYVYLLEGLIIRKLQLKRWKIKEILN